MAQSPLPGALHLTPCILDQYLQQGHDNEDPYELVDGLLVSLPRMGLEHGLIVNHLLHLFTILPDTVSDPVECYINMEYLPQARKRGNSNRDTVRLPNLFLVRKSEDSYSSDHSDWKSARMIIQVTGLNRNNDLILKREEYQQDKVPEYVIIDRQKGLPAANRRPCVEVHTLDGRGYYKKKVYYNNQQVDCSYLTHWKLTADDLLDYKALRRIFDKEKKEQDRALQWYAEEQKKRDRAEQERERLERERDRAEQERERLERERERLERERDQLIAYIKGESKTLPRGLEVDPSELRSDLKGSSISPTLPKSPVSPPHRVRKTTNSDVKNKPGNGKKSKGA